MLIILQLKYFMKNFTLLLVAIFAINLGSKAAVITATATGNWNAAATWNGPIPGAADVVFITGGRAVTITAGTTFTVISITIGSSANNANSLVMANTASLTVTNTITLVPSTTTTNTARINLLNVASGIITCNGLFSSNSGFDPKDCNISISTGTLDVNGDAILGAATTQNALTFSGAGLFQVSGTFTGGGTFTPSTGTVEYDGGVQTLNPNITTYNNLISSNSGVKTLGATISIGNNLSISGTTQLDPTAAPFNLSVAGNWNVTSTDPDPFVERTSRVTFNGSTSAQTITTPLTSETFYNATFSNTFGTSPQMSTTSHINVTNDIDWTAGALNLTGKNLVITGGTATSALSTGTILTTVAGSSITITDPTDTYTVDFNNFTIGTNTTTGAIPVTMTSNSSTWIGSKFYGATNFTKTGINADDFAGGNFFYGPSCYFKTTNTAARWRMGNNSPTPDVFYNATFDANGAAPNPANKNFIVGANSIGNEYFGTTTLISTTPGGFFVGRVNGTGNNSHIFHGPITVSVTATGNITIGDADASNSSTITIENTLALNSSSTSVGDIYIGSSTGYSSVTLTGAGQIIDGTIQGATNIYFNSINQVNATTLSTISTATTNSTIFVANNNSAGTRCVFNGNVNFTSPNINLRGGTFNGTNNFTANGASALSSYGGNIFNGTSTFINNGTGDWNLGNNVADDFNGNVVFNRNSSGILTPASLTNGTFSGNLSTVGSNSVVTFCASSTTGTVTIDGNGTQTFSGSSTRIPIIRKLVMNTTASGSLTLNVPLNVNSSLLMTSGNIVTTSTNSLTLTSSAVTANIGNSNSFVDGPLFYNVANTATNTINFPIGKGSTWRPLTLRQTNSVATSFTFKAEMFNSSARSLSYTLPGTVNRVSDYNYWDIDRTLTSSGAAMPTQSLTGNQAVTLYYTAGDGVNDGANLAICKNTSTATTTWIDIGGTGGSAGAGSVSSTSAPTVFTSYSRFTLGNKNAGTNPLPIELVSFTATKNNKVVDVKWETASELNNDYFEVEKSKNGIDFETLTYVKGAGNITVRLNYKTVDENPFNGISYYRLKQVDLDQTFTYSQIQSVEFEKGKDFAFDIFPNPSEGNTINVSFENADNGEVLVVVFDVTGKESYSKVLITNEANNAVYAIDPSNTLAPGVYLITATSNQKIYSKRLIVK
jgi:hypothetical protein